MRAINPSGQTDQGRVRAAEKGSWDPRVNLNFMNCKPRVRIVLVIYVIALL